TAGPRAGVLARLQPALHYARRGRDASLRSRAGSRKRPDSGRQQPSRTAFRWRFPLRAVAEGGRRYTREAVGSEFLASCTRSFGPHCRGTAKALGRKPPRKRGRLMIETGTVEAFGWPAARLGDALSELAVRAGIGNSAVELPAACPAGSEAGEWLDWAAKHLGCEAEPIESTLRDLERDLACA